MLQNRAVWRPVRADSIATGHTCIAAARFFLLDLRLRDHSRVAPAAEERMTYSLICPLAHLSLAILTSRVPSDLPIAVSEAAKMMRRAR